MDFFLCSSSAGWNVTFSEIIVSITGLCDSTCFQTGNRTRKSIGLLKCLLKCCLRIEMKWFRAGIRLNLLAVPAPQTIIRAQQSNLKRRSNQESPRGQAHEL